MKSARTSRRNAAALGFSAVFHIVVLALIVSQASPIYELPEPPPTPPMEAQIVQMEEPPPPVVILRTPLPKPAPVETRPPTPPRPQPPTPTPPSPAKAQPQPTPTATPLPSPIAPKPTPPQVETAKPLPLAAPRAEPRPVAAPVVAPTPPAPPAPPAPRAAPSPPAPMRLNIHKPEKEAPGNVPTLPLSPAPAPAASAGGPKAATTAGGEPELGGSRLSGLTPYPYGSMPSGGSGIRGSLVGCANAEAVSLSSVERAKCNERFGRDAASAPALDTMSPLKRAAFDKAAAKEDANRAYRSAVPTGTTPGKPGFGSGLGPDQPQGLHSLLGGPQ